MHARPANAPTVQASPSGANILRGAGELKRRDRSRSRYRSGSREPLQRAPREPTPPAPVVHSRSYDSKRDGGGNRLPSRSSQEYQKK